jgi:hypothetical protein
MDYKFDFFCASCQRNIKWHFLGELDCALHVKNYSTVMNGTINGNNSSKSCYECCGVSVDPTSENYYKSKGILGCVRSDHVRSIKELNEIIENPFFLIKDIDYPRHRDYILHCKKWEDINVIIKYYVDKKEKTLDLRNIYFDKFGTNNDHSITTDIELYDPDINTNDDIVFTNCKVVLRREIDNYQLLNR